MRSTFISAIAAGGLLLSTTAAGAQQPGPIPARTGAEVGQSEEAIGIMAILLFAALVLAVGVIVLIDDGDSDRPTSP
jgi:hypothetical protein